MNGVEAVDESLLGLWKLQYSNHLQSAIYKLFVDDELDAVDEQRSWDLL